MGEGEGGGRERGRGKKLWQYRGIVEKKLGFEEGSM